MGGMSVIWTACAAGAVVGAALVWFGLRGRRVGDHPFCRRCGFDLFGRPEGSAVCAECGADLGRRKSIVIGTRPRRRWAAVSGSLVLLPALAGAGLLGWGTARNVDWQKHKPDWWLVREADSTVASIRDDALKALRVRLTANQLPPSRVAQLVGRGMQCQADASKTWTTRWGDLIESARAANRVSDEDWRKYAEQGVANYTSILYRKKFRRHDELTFALSDNGGRFGSGRWWHMQQVLDSVEVGAQKVSLRHEMRSGIVALVPVHLNRNHAWTQTISPTKDLLKELPDGVHGGNVCIDIVVRDARQGGSNALRSARGSRAVADPVVVSHLRLPFQFEMVRDDQDILEPIIDATLRKRVADSLHISRARLSGAVLSAQFGCDPAPVDLAFEVIGVVNGRECKLGMFAASQREHRSSQTLSCPLPWQPSRSRVDAIDIIFRPEAAAATNRLDINRYWKHEIVMKDIEVDDLLHHTAAEIRAREERAKEAAKR